MGGGTVDETREPRGLAGSGEVVPLTEFQRALLAALASTPNDDRYLAGGAALHFAPNSTRYSDDLDFFHDSEARVASAFAADRDALRQAGYQVDLEMSLPGFVRALVRKGEEATRVDWAHDSAWRFMPLVRDRVGGLLLHPVDLALNKVLALAGRDEPRDFVDMLFVHRRILPLAGLCWAAAGKDPGFTPRSLLELLKRRGRYRAEDFSRLRLAQPFDLASAKETWLEALADAETFARERPPEESGCLYYSTTRRQFVVPGGEMSLADQGVVPHFGAPGGVIPRVSDARIEGTDP
jgi:hypothetical protein